jgi:hypothetical protein
MSGVFKTAAYPKMSGLKTRQQITEHAKIDNKSAGHRTHQNETQNSRSPKLSGWNTGQQLTAYRKCLE